MNSNEVLRLASALCWLLWPIRWLRWWARWYVVPWISMCLLEFLPERKRGFQWTIEREMIYLLFGFFTFENFRFEQWNEIMRFLIVRLDEYSNRNVRFNENLRCLQILGRNWGQVRSMDCAILGSFFSKIKSIISLQNKTNYQYRFCRLLQKSCNSWIVFSARSIFWYCSFSFCVNSLFFISNCSI